MNAVRLFSLAVAVALSASNAEACPPAIPSHAAVAAPVVVATPAIVSVPTSAIVCPTVVQGFVAHAVVVPNVVVQARVAPVRQRSVSVQRTFSRIRVR